MGPVSVHLVVSHISLMVLVVLVCRDVAVVVRCFVLFFFFIVEADMLIVMSLRYLSVWIVPVCTLLSYC